MNKPISQPKRTTNWRAWLFGVFVVLAIVFLTPVFWLQYQTNHQPTIEITGVEIQAVGPTGHSRASYIASWFGWRKIFAQDAAAITDVRVVDIDGNESDIEPVLQQAGSSIRVSLPQDPQGFKPGKYTLQIDIERAGQVFTSSQDFTLGVLSVNVDTSHVVAGESVYVQLAALDDTGHTLCQAPLELTITDPVGAEHSFTVSDSTITLSGDCGPNNVTDIPDYYIHFADTQIAGIYHMALTNTDTGYVVSDQFTVAQSLDYQVTRRAATRINPFKSSYTMRMNTNGDISAAQFVERVPANFSISAHNADDFQTIDEFHYLIWQAPDADADFWYTYQAPQISPYAYTLGPAGIYNESEKLADIIDTLVSPLFYESRQWQLASDAAGDFAVWRETTGGETLGTTVATVPWDTAVTVGTGFSLAGNTTINTPGASHYLIWYNLSTETSGGANRTEANAWIDIVNGTAPAEDQVYGRSTCYVRRQEGTNECWLSGAAVYELSATNDIQIQAQRTDNNTATITRRANESGVGILQLDSSWDYARVREAGGGQTFNLTTWETVDWDTNDELDAGTFSRTGGDITLATKGHYLVTANIMFQNSSGANRRNSEMRLTLDSVEIPGTRTTAYLRGSNSTQDHATSYVGVIETSANNQVLRLQGRCEGEACSGITNVGDQTGITITKLPDTGEYIRLYETVGGQAVDATNDPITWDTQSEVDTASFTHSTVTNPSRITIAKADDYLFFGSFYSFRSSTADTNRQYPHWFWRLNGTTTYQYGHFGKFNRGDQGTTGTFSGGASAAILMDGLAVNDYVELLNTDESTGADPTNTFIGDRYAVQGINLTELFATNPNVRQEHFRWRPVGSGALAINANGGGDWEAAEDTNFSADIARGDDLRLRLLVANTGTGAAGAGKTYELEFGTKVTTCDAISTWTGVADAADDFDMVAASGFAEAAATTNLLTGSGGTFQAGEGRETADTTGSVGPLAVSDFTEHEYSFEASLTATQGSTFCFRLYDTTAGAPLDSYGVYPELTIASPAVVQNHYRWRNKNPSGVGLNDNGGGDWAAAEDTDFTTQVYKNETLRLRIQAANTGTAAEDAGKTYQLQYGVNPSACSAVASWTAVGASANDAFDMVASADFVEGAATTAVLTATGTFVAGEGRETADATGTIGPLTNGQYTEHEYSFQANVNATNGTTYCFRLYDTAAGAVLNTYSVYPSVTIVGGLKVQKIIGSISGTTSATESIPETLADVNNAFIFFDSSGDSVADNLPQEATCTAYISSTSQITVEKSVAGGTCIYAIYVVEALNNEFAVRSRGSINIPGASLTGTGAADNIASIGDINNVFVPGMERSNADNVAEWSETDVTIELTNATTVTAERAVNTGNDVIVDVRYEVVEWLASGVSVQTNEVTLTNLNTTPQTDTISTAVDTGRSFVYSHFRHNSNGLAQTSIEASLASATTVEFVRSTGTQYTSTARWWVIEFPENGVTVQRGDGADATGSNNEIDVTIPIAVNTGRAFPISYMSNSGTGTAFPRGRYRSDLQSSTLLNIENGYSGNTVGYSWQVIDTSGWIPEYLSFSLSDNTIGFGEIETTQIRYATGDTLGTTSETVAHTATVRTTAQNGYALYIQGPTLTHGNGTDNIDAIGGTATALVAGTEQFGMRATASGGQGSVSSPYNTTNYAYAATSQDEIASSTIGDNVTTTYSFYYGGNITGVTPGGQYDTTITYVVVPTF